MSILIDENTRVLVQGITGKEGSRAAKLMKESGTKVVCGVTPGKGGQEVEGCPVYNSVAEALKKHPEVNASIVYVPPFAAKDAVIESVKNGIKLVNCITENIPVRDTAEMVAYARKHNSRLVGPSSIGIISPGKSRLGVIGGEISMLKEIYKPGEIGIISKSGGMTNETAWVIRQSGLGQSTVVGIGGDVIIGSSFTDLLELFERDEQTKGVVIFGELGGTYEEQVAEMIRKKKFTKPLAAFIAGKFAEKMESGKSFGHAGAIIEGSKGLPSEKAKELKSSGAIVVDNHHELGDAIKNAIR